MGAIGKLAAAALGLAWLAGAPAEDQTTAPLLPELPAAVEGEGCVEPLDVIRREHMELLLHQRDATVYLGERGTDHSLKECLACHTQKDAQGAYIPANAEGQFCNECHTYVGVQMDCFECHAGTPAGGKPTGSRAER